MYRYAERFYIMGDVRPMTKGNGPSFLLCEFEELYLIQLVLFNPGIYLKELQKKLADYTGCIVHVSTICRTLHRLRLSRQCIKFSPPYVSQNDAMRAEFLAEMSAYDISAMLWLDESGFDKRNHFRKRRYGVWEQPTRISQYEGNITHPLLLCPLMELKMFT